MTVWDVPSVVLLRKVPVVIKMTKPAGFFRRSLPEKRREILRCQRTNNIPYGWWWPIVKPFLAARNALVDLQRNVVYQDNGSSSPRLRQIAPTSCCVQRSVMDHYHPRDWWRSHNYEATPRLRLLTIACRWHPNGGTTNSSHCPKNDKIKRINIRIFV